MSFLWSIIQYKIVRIAIIFYNLIVENIEVLISDVKNYKDIEIRIIVIFIYYIDLFIVIERKDYNHLI